MAQEGGPSRRAVLGWAGAAGLAALTGCSSSTPTPRGTPGRSPSQSPSPSAKAPSFEQLSARLSRPLLRPGSRGYDGRRRLYNPRFDATSRPAAIAACRTAADVQACVRFAAEGGAPLRLRAGGHSYGGWSSGPGLVVDVAGMATVDVDADGRTARIGAGARLADVYRAVAAKGLALAAGSCPTVGLTGLALGGGVGVLTRAYGLTCDALRSVQLVTADGRLRDTSSTSDADLFWALRGAGAGSFGAVTALTVALRPAPTVQTFFLSYPPEQAADVLDAWQRWAPTADTQLWSTCKLLSDRDGLRVVVAGTWLGPADQLGTRIRGLALHPTTDRRRTLDYGAAMLLEAGCSGDTTADCTATALAHRQPFAATSSILTDPLPAAGLEAAVAAAREGGHVPNLVEYGMSFDALGGTVADKAPSDTAFPHRRALATVQHTATWTDGDAAPFDRQVRKARTALAPWTGDAAYVNYADPVIEDYGRAYWGDNLPRLREVKRRYDPEELFTFPQAVRV